MENVYSYLTNKWHNQLKDQVILHAVCNLIQEPYDPCFNGVTAYGISSTACKIFSNYGQSEKTTGDISTCSLMVQNLVSLLIERGIFSESQIQTECARLWTELYQARYPQGMP